MSMDLSIQTRQSKKMIDDVFAFLTHLPSEIILDILLRLPIRTIVWCKCVCRKLLELISSAPFADLHLSKSNPGLIIHQMGNDQNLCRIFEFEDGLDIQQHDHHYIPLMEFSPQNSILTSSDANLCMEGGSVNGLLCMHDIPSHLDAFYICNPITREYIALPKTKQTVQYPDSVMYGFGVSSSGEYKLVRINQSSVTSSGPSSRNFPGFELMIYTLGSGSWRTIQLSDTFELNPYPGGAFLHGNLHWLVGDLDGCSFIACFDLETEQFKPFPAHPFPSFFPIKGSFGVLGDCLCFCDCSSDDEIVIWVMKEYGVGESWTQEYTINKDIGHLGGLSYEAVVPLKVFKDGDILLYWQDTSLFYYSSKTETAPDFDLFTVDQLTQIEPMIHTPSFLSLKRFENENVASF